MSAQKKSLIVVTGASSGIGEACARAFAAQGHPVLALARRQKEMEERFADEPLITAAKCDVTVKGDLEAAIAAAESEHGPVDCLVNNAGVMLLHDFTTQKEEEFDLMLQVNVRGVINGLRAVLAGMKARKAGTIVNVSSIAGIKGFPNHAVYCGTKYAVRGITEVLREECAPLGVRFVSICPGAVETELLGHTTDSKVIDGYNDWKETMPLGVLQPQDVSDAVLFAYNAPPRCCVREIVLGPTNQGP